MQAPRRRRFHLLGFWRKLWNTAMKMTSDKRAIDKIYKRRNRYEIPDWQRQPVWSRARQQELIDSILRGWKLPKFYFLKTSSDEEQQYEVVDGQQRLTSIFEFFDNKLPLRDETAAEFGGRYYKDLPAKISDEFDDYDIQFDQLAVRGATQLFPGLRMGIALR